MLLSMCCLCVGVGCYTSGQTPKFHERTPKREKKERKLWREREKKREFWAGPPSEPPPFASGPPPFGSFTLPCRTDCETTKTQILAKKWIGQCWIGQNLFWPKLAGPQNTVAKWTGQNGLAKCGQTRMAKNGFAKNDLSRTLLSRPLCGVE